MGDRFRNARNVIILLLLAVVVWRLPGGAAGGLLVTNLISLVFWGGLLFFVYRLYMERRATLFGWGDKLRGQLYGSIGVLMLLIVATARMFSLGSIGALVWFALLGGALWGIWTAFRTARSY